MTPRQRDQLNVLLRVTFTLYVAFLFISWALIATAQPLQSDPLACSAATARTQAAWKPITLPDDTKLEWRVAMSGEDLRSIDLRYPGGTQGRFLAGTRVIRCGDAFPQDALYILLTAKNSIISEASHFLRMPGFADRLAQQIDHFAESLQTASRIPAPRP
jgi:hypothetical protein